jgi:hypothetical protein
LGTPAQIKAEKTAMALLKNPQIKAAQEKLRNALKAYPLYAMAGAPAALDHALQEWTLALAMRHQAADLSAPHILWQFDDAPHKWFGYVFPGASGIGDNPDSVYRTTFVDGRGRYELVGKLSRMPPTQFTFETGRATPGMRLDKPLTPGAVDVGVQIGMLTGRTLKVERDGSFRIIIGGDPVSYGNYLPTNAGLTEVSMRDILGDWNQQPNKVEIHRLDAGKGAALSRAELTHRVAADLSTFVRFWLDAGLRWTGKAAENALLGPLPRDGGFGFISNCRYKIAPGQALVATVDPRNAEYFSIQAVGPWSIAPDVRKHTSSLNKTQSAAAADGTITYVVSPDDPGVANWIDTGGFREGYLLMRWQAMPAGVKPSELVRRFEIVTLAQIAKDNIGPRMDAAQRRVQIAARAADHDKRLGE